MILQVQVLAQLEAPGQPQVCVPSGICAHMDKQESVGVRWASTSNRRKGQSGLMCVHVQSWVTLPKGICQPWSPQGLEGNFKNLFKDTSKLRAPPVVWEGEQWGSLLAPIYRQYCLWHSSFRSRKCHGSLPQSITNSTSSYCFDSSI